MEYNIETAESNLEVWIGKSKAILITLSYLSSGAALDITGWTFWFTAKTRVGDSDGDALIQSEVDTHTDAESGLTTITLSEVHTAALAGQSKIWYDIAYRTSDGATGILCYGKIIAKQPITRTNS